MEKVKLEMGILLGKQKEGNVSRLILIIFIVNLKCLIFVDIDSVITSLDIYVT